MTTDQKLRDASASVRDATQHAEFTVEVPGRHSTRSCFAAMVTAAALALLVVGLPLVVLNISGGSGSDAVTSELLQTTVAPTVETPVPTTTPQSAPVDITGLVADVVASSELSSAYKAEYLIDGDLDRSWQDASLRGVGAEITLFFDQPVAISEIIIYPLSDTVRFRRNYRVQGYTIRVDDQSEAVVGRLQNSNEAQVVMVGSSATTVLTLSVTTTHPAEPVAEKPPFDELAIAEIRVFGDVPVGSSAPLTTLAPNEAGEPPPVVIDDASSRFESPVFDAPESQFPWDVYIENASGGNVPVELRGQLVRVYDDVMHDLGALPLQFSSDTHDPGVSEAATFLFQSSPASPTGGLHGDLGISWILISVGWQEWDGRTEANPLGFPSDAVREQWGGDSVFINIEAEWAEFGAINVGALKTVRFAPLDTEILNDDGLERFAISEEEMRQIAAWVFEVIKP
jgi:hypothetical protein